MKNKSLAVISIATRQNIESDIFCKDVLEVLISCIPELKPEFIGSFEPINQPFLSIDDAIRNWDSTFFWKGKKKSKILGSVFFGNTQKLSTIQIEFNFSECESQKIIEFINKLGRIIQIDVAYYHCLSELELESLSYKLQKVLEFGFFIQDLKLGIPILPWFVVFGEVYINLITETKLLSTPSFITKKLNDKLISIQLTKEDNDLIDDYRNFQIARKKATEHLSGFFWGDNSVLTPKEYIEMGNFGGGDFFKKIAESQNNLKKKE